MSIPTELRKMLRGYVDELGDKGYTYVRLTIEETEEIIAALQASPLAAQAEPPQLIHSDQRLPEDGQLVAAWWADGTHKVVTASRNGFRHGDPCWWVATQEKGAAPIQGEPVAWKSREGWIFFPEKPIRIPVDPLYTSPSVEALDAARHFIVYGNFPIGWNLDRIDAAMAHRDGE